MKEAERILIKKYNYTKSDIDNMEIYEWEYLIEKMLEDYEKEKVSGN